MTSRTFQISQVTMQDRDDASHSASVPEIALAFDKELAAARDLYRHGDPQGAARLLQGVLSQDPRDAEALALLGVVTDATGDPARAALLLSQALEVGETASRRCNLGMVLGHMDRHADAIVCYERALVLRPGYPEALNNLGTSLEALGRAAEAEAAFRQALAARPGFAVAWSNLGNALRSLGRISESVTAYEQAVAANPAISRAPLAHALSALGQSEAAQAAFRIEVARQPGDRRALNDLAAALGEAGRPDEAAALLPEATRLQPDFPEAHTNLAQALQQLGRGEEAIAACEQALRLRPDSPQALTILGNTLRDLDRLAESEAVLRRALALRPTAVAAYNTLAITLQGQDRPHEALAVLDLAAALDPQDAETHHHRAMLLLRQGRFAEGWAAYEWRFRTRQAGRSHVQFDGQPRWQGEPLDGRTLLLVPEQGFGDTIQFARYAPMVAARGGRVMMGVQKPLARLLAGLPGVDRFVGIGEALPPYDLHCPLLSLPGVFGTNLETIPTATAYLQAEPDLAARWQERLNERAPALRVGVVWAGNPRHVGDRQRSLPFEALEPLWRLPGIGWHSLQVGPNAAPWGADAPPGRIQDLAPLLTDFAETAAAVTALDLVISADTAVAHLAAALGRPVWLLLPATPDWRWRRTGESTPWYPTMRLFRQDARRSWAPVIEAVAGALEALARAG